MQNTYKILYINLADEGNFIIHFKMHARCMFVWCANFQRQSPTNHRSARFIQSVKKPFKL